MKRIRKGWNEYWAERVLIQVKQARAGEEDFAEEYRKEADFIREVLCLSPGRKALDLGCGTGEHCLALARRGIDTTGIDIAPVLVERACKQATKAGLSAAFVCADMRTFRPETQFDAVFTSSGTFGAFEKDADNRSVLRTIHAALKDSGRFLIGPGGPGLLKCESFSEKDWLLMEDGCFLREIAWDRPTGLFHENFFFIDEEGTVIEFAGFDGASDGLRSPIYSLGQLQEMIADEGLVFKAAYGSFELPPKPIGTTPRLLIVGCRAHGKQGR